MFKKTRTFVFMMLVFVATCPSTLAAPKLADAVKQFNTGVQQTTTAFQTYYSQMNDCARDVYFEKLLLNPSEKISSHYLDKTNTGLYCRFANSDVNARLTALRVISAYAQGLAQFADPDLSKDNADSVQNFGYSILQLNKDLAALGQSNPVIAAYATPVSALAALVTKSWISWTGDKSIRDSVKTAGPEVDKLIVSLQADVKKTMNGFYKNDAQAILIQYTHYYNNQMVEKKPQGSDPDDVKDDSAAIVDSGTKDGEAAATKPVVVEQVRNTELSAPAFDVRAALLKRAKKAADRYAHLTAIDPSDLLVKMKKAHDQLEDCASEKKNKPEDLKEALAEVNDYVSAAQAYSDAVSEIRRASLTGDLQ